MIEQDHQSFHALTFNLATIYELCTGSDATTKQMKLNLAEKVAKMAPTPASAPTSSLGGGSGRANMVGVEVVGGRRGARPGWEGTNADFKL